VVKKILMKTDRCDDKYFFEGNGGGALSYYN
jgi:hypothetical protein